MELPLELNPAKEKRVKRAAGLRCELCGGSYPADLLEIHLLPGPGGRVGQGPDLQREILVLCSRCHRDIHESLVSRADQKVLVRSRHVPVRKAIRHILGHRPASYRPPEVDLAVAYDEVLRFPSFVLNGSG